jgi:SAM-dependent methyltransferase
VPFDRTWEAIFQSRGWGRYPSEDVVRLVAHRFFRVPDRTLVKILDLGCGGGANTWFLAREGFRVTAVDGSAAAVARTSDLLAREGCAADVGVRDFLDLSFSDEMFDAVLDCASIQHNPWDDIVLVHRHVFRILKPGGWFLGLLLNTDSSHSRGADAPEGSELCGFRAGTLDDGVFVHLFSRDELDVLLAPYEATSVDSVCRTVSGGTARITQFIVAAQKGAAG